MKVVLAIAAVCLGLLGCGDTGTVTDGPLVVYEHGGGLAPEPRRLVVERDGRATLTVLPGADETRRQFDLTTTQLGDLEDQLTAAQGDTVSDEPTDCRDCFGYSIRAERIDVGLDDVSLADATDDLRRLVGTLERLSAP